VTSARERADDRIEFVLFDLGGVLVDVGGVSQMRTLAHIDSDDELWERWLTSPWVRHFERGHCSADDFAVGMVTEWHLDLTPEEFLDNMSGWMTGPMPGVAALLEETRKRVPIACLSNINAMHWDRLCAEGDAFDAFAHRFLSFEIGMVKPDVEFFDYIGATLAVPRHQILFLDDNSLNVNAAEACGFSAQKVQGVDQARAALIDAGVLVGGA
jgi:putative hydrolase of the HAD superfamily